jgi:hypothetical protein
MEVLEIIRVIGVDIRLFNLQPLVDTVPETGRSNCTTERTALLGLWEALFGEEIPGDHEKLPMKFGVVALG